ncbi:PP2C family protein-serine/threonine phosphatase [Sphingobium bisphenolivorans]|uniref:PP2C family protein-serine/threonine phosphatase n=1 Tax=Sphingobium bisphenolivorans TaxID=1335760 RepID=UPI0003B313F4|nr:protein phosphatase 2C domain-containing protein [Sphingobium bisphenolivorans]
MRASRARACDPQPALRSVAKTHIGRVRSVNEDRILDCPESHIWAVADGMGGHSRGDRAATLVVQALASLTADGRPVSAAAVASALSAANDQILALGRSGETCGSTVAGLYVEQGRCTLFWAGDSRIYRLRRGRLQLLSHDHSYVQQLADAGLLTPGQARGHPHANVITRAIGIGPHPNTDHAVCDLAGGDRLLLCSDGLSSMVDDSAIECILKLDPALASEKLVEAALKAGGTDNISLIIVDVDRP